MLRASCFAPSLARASSSLFALIFNTPSVFFRPRSISSFRWYNAPLVVKGTRDKRPFLVDQNRHMCTTSLTAKESKLSPSYNLSRKSKKKAQRDSPEALLKVKLDMCSKRGDVVQGLRLYDEAMSNGVLLNQYHYNVVLYLCSLSSATSTEATISSPGLQRGFDIFRQMIADKIVPNEATFTNVARLAVALDDPEMAFDMVRQMKTFGVQPRLRSYGPALFGFCNKGYADKAYEVDAHMVESEVIAEEPELSALLEVSVCAKKTDKVYEMLHRLRASVRQVSESTFGTIEEWFKSEEATNTGTKDWDAKKVRVGVLRGGGGWHGQGWLGTGKWNVTRTEMDENGVCKCCKEKLVCVDIDPMETENFASSLTKLACEKETRANFNQFQDWLQKRGPFDAVIDAANMGLVNQRNFSFFQLNNVVKRCRQMSPSKRLPLIILHQSRVNGGPALNPQNRALLEKWKNAGALYATPAGSNDDWYWLYAAVSCKCLLVTNDEMRDHLFQLLGNSFFPRWKEKHQVRVSVSREEGLNLHMPPPYSIVIQESEDGRWHVPMSVDDDLQTSRQWLCATRARSR